MATQGKVARSEDHLDAQIRNAVDEVDSSLLDWMLSLTPRQRLRAVSKASMALSRFHRVPS